MGDKDAEKLIELLEERGELFPGFLLQRNKEGKPVLLGSGGFSFVYEMYEKNDPHHLMALKVNGLMGDAVPYIVFWNAAKHQFDAGNTSDYVVRVWGMKELLVQRDQNGNITEVKESGDEVLEGNTQDLRLQFLLMEKLELLIEKGHLSECAPKNESEVLNYALQIGQVILAAHQNHFIHRDIKIENTFWDAEENVYKLGDFGCARELSESGTAETGIYTPGYNAPEIRTGHYDERVDIYSFGITLYLLLNELRFPGSNGYYVIPCQDDIFMKPKNASPEMTAVLRKMCSYDPDNRYPSMSEVLLALKDIVISVEDKESKLYAMAETVARTCCARTETRTVTVGTTTDTTRGSADKEMSRSEIKRRQKIVDLCYREDSIKYLLLLTGLFFLFYKAMQPDLPTETDQLFWILPVAVLFEALLQRIREFHLFFGVLVVAGAVFFMYEHGLSLVPVILIMCMIIECPVLTAAGGLSAGIWMVLSRMGYLSFLDFLYRLDLGWIVFGLVLLAAYRYFRMRIIWNKTTYLRAYLSTWIFDRIFPAMSILGIVLWILQKCNVLILPEILVRLHSVRTGVICFIAMLLFDKWDGYEDDMTDDTEEVVQ